MCSIGHGETSHQLRYDMKLKMSEEQVKFATHALIALVEDNPEIFKGQ